MEDNFSKIANEDMRNFVLFWGYYGLSFHISIDGLKSTKFRAYAHIWAYVFWLITQSFLVNLNTNLYTSVGDY